jgi:tetratricopeptide (TPR) repeat protein
MNSPWKNLSVEVGRNDPCPCGSGKKFKRCCGAKQEPVVLGARPSPALRQRLQALSQAALVRWDSGRWADAIPIMMKIVRLDPNSPQAHHDLGVMYACCGRLAEATESLQTAVQLSPSFESALSYLAKVLELHGRQDEALVACRKLERIAADPLVRKHYAAKALVKEGKLEDAEREFRRLLALDPGRPDVLLAMGQLLTDRGEFQEAERCLTAALEGAPAAFQHLAGVKRMTEVDRPLIDRMRAVLGRPDLIVSDRVAVHFGLGKAFDDLGDWSEAMRHYRQGNDLRALSARLDRGVLARHYDDLIVGFSNEGLENAVRSVGRSARREDNLPVFIVGMPRSGTTLTEQILSSHPAVAAGGELGFWTNSVAQWGANSLQADEISTAAEDYLALLRTVGPSAARVTDKSPWNFQLLWVLRIAFPDARIIHCRRNPLDTCLSIYFTNFARQDFAWDLGDLAFQYRQYERLMDHWRSVLPGDRFTEVQYEMLVADRVAETRRLIAFIGLDWDDACLAPERNPRVVGNASSWQARQPVYKTSVERWRRYEPWLGELQKLLPTER